MKMGSESYKFGTTFEFIKEPFRSGGTVNKLMACPVGRQVAVRDIKNNGVHIIKKQHDADQITALTSAVNHNDQKSIFAVAETSYSNPNELNIDIYDVGVNGEFQFTGHRKRIEVLGNDE